MQDLETAFVSLWVAPSGFGHYLVQVFKSGATEGVDFSTDKQRAMVGVVLVWLEVRVTRLDNECCVERSFQSQACGTGKEGKREASRVMWW